MSDINQLVYEALSAKEKREIHQRHDDTIDHQKLKVQGDHHSHAVGGPLAHTFDKFPSHVSVSKLLKKHSKIHHQKRGI